MATTQTPKTTTCGFCETFAHHLCPSGIRNGDGGMVLCVCPAPDCNAGSRRCTDCNNRNQDEVTADWRCADLDACQSEQEAKRNANPFVQMMAKVRATREALEMQPGVRTTPKAASGSEAPSRAGKVLSRPSVAGPRGCLCLCGGTTKGGKFLPGHDSRYLNALVANPGADSYTLAYAVSEAFGKKYEKRITK